MDASPPHYEGLIMEGTYTILTALKLCEEREESSLHSSCCPSCLTLQPCLLPLLLFLFPIIFISSLVLPSPSLHPPFSDLTLYPSPSFCSKSCSLPLFHSIMILSPHPFSLHSSHFLSLSSFPPPINLYPFIPLFLFLYPICLTAFSHLSCSALLSIPLLLIIPCSFYFPSYCPACPHSFTSCSAYPSHPHSIPLYPILLMALLICISLPSFSHLFPLSLSISFPFILLTFFLLLCILLSLQPLL